MAVQLPPCPASLRAIQHYLKTASDYDQRDPVISYWCRLYALQSGLRIDRSSQEAKVLLTALMDWLETQKKRFTDNESVTNDVAAQAYIENAALKLFNFADVQDRAANFGKDVVKAFYTAGMLYDVLTTFGEPTEEVSQNRKYAKWKAAYIHRCLKSGEQPVPGPMREEGDEGDEEGAAAAGGYRPPPAAAGGFQAPGFNVGPGPAPQQPPPPSQYDFPEPPSSFPPPAAGNFPPSNAFVPSPHSNPYNPPTTPIQPANPGFPTFPSAAPSIPGEIGDATSKAGGVSLTADQMNKAQKYCKWAGSALSYDDVPTAVDNLKKALRLLETGVDS